MNDTQNNLGYCIDAADEIVAVSDNWDRFALENDAPPELLSGSILHRRFWDFVSGETLRHVYRRILAKVRKGQALVFSFRCDSAAFRRYLTLRMSPTDGGGVEFLTETVRTEEREYQPLFDAKAARGGEIVVACSWCNKIKTGVNIWLEPEDAVPELGLFENDSLPPLSHGMCEECYKAVLG
jgi:hypothetical protein